MAVPPPPPWDIGQVLFCMFMDITTEFRFIKTRKKGILTEEAWSIKDLLLAFGEFFLWDTAGSPKAIHLACLGSQSQHLAH